jgi:hypothetical protein
LTLLGGPPSPLSTRTDFRSRLDRGFTTSLFATFFEGMLIRRALPLSASYGAVSFKNFSSGYFIPLCLCDSSIRCIRKHSLCAFAITQYSSCLSWGSVQGVSWGSFLSILVIFIFRYSPTLHIRDFHIRYYRTPPFYWERKVSVTHHDSVFCVCTLCFSTSFFLFIPHAYFLRIFPLYPCVHPYVLHHPSPSVWRSLYLEGHIYLEGHLYLEGSICFEGSWLVLAS